MIVLLAQFPSLGRVGLEKLPLPDLRDGNVESGARHVGYSQLVCKVLISSDPKRSPGVEDQPFPDLCSGETQLEKEDNSLTMSAVMKNKNNIIHPRV